MVEGASNPLQLSLLCFSDRQPAPPIRPPFRPRRSDRRPLPPTAAIPNTRRCRLNHLSNDRHSRLHHPSNIPPASPKPFQHTAGFAYAPFERITGLAATTCSKYSHPRIHHPFDTATVTYTPSFRNTTTLSYNTLPVHRQPSLYAVLPANCNIICFRQLTLNGQ